MNIPPFPAQDLAKLVLGYLAEEQLMTAYDEFLSASPYLDALKNEYDRIFMTSLRNIVAEYRAIKIFVETFVPYPLRRRLLSCPNLLEIVKFLVQNVDINKLQPNEGNRGSLEHRNTSEKPALCTICHTLPNCICKGTQTPAAEQSFENSVESTCLEDLPGSRRRQVKTLSKDNRMAPSISSDSSSDINVDVNYTSSFSHSLPNESLSSSKIHTLQSGVYSNNNLNQPPQKNPEDAHSNNTRIFVKAYKTCAVKNKCQRISMTEPIPRFSMGVKGGENFSCNVPDSSTTESSSKQSTTSKDISLPGSAVANNAKPVSKAHIFLTVGTINTSSPIPATTSTQTLQRPKPNESKVTILSDVKVDRFSKDVPKMPAVLNNAPPPPLMHMQTILINGTEVYKPQPPVLGCTRHFTKDEIMAMPTIIVAPTSGESQVTSAAHSGITTQSSNSLTTKSTSAELLQPLAIDVPDDSDATQPLDTKVPHNMPLLDQQKEKETIVVKTLDAKMVSAPKGGGENKNTPEVLPPVRKSSSTPRRTSHIRVLDFATPRRILQEAVTENASEDDGAPVEVVISRSPNLQNLAETAHAERTKIIAVQNSNAESISSSKDSETNTKKHWDADLRAIAIPNRKEDIPKSLIQPRCRPRQKKADKNKLTLSNKRSKEKANKNKKERKTDVDDNSTKKSIKSDCVQKLDEVIVISEEAVVLDDNSSVPVKPTINIITGQNRSDHDNEKNNSEPADTPEMDRVSLQNAIGAKLNISDLLETPYKQALYDIQMETPRFLGPDLPGEPLSDIKIMNIPTPRFLDTPKPVESTPSYASRPTDYSSGSSYYRPDDQDYVIPNDLECSASGSKNKEIPNSLDKASASLEENSTSKTGKSRPVRRCTKNVSYYQTPHVNKMKETEEKWEKASTCSDTLSIKSMSDDKIERQSEHRTVKEKKSEHKLVKETKLVTENNAKEDKPIKENKSEKESKTKRTSVPKKLKSPLKRGTPKSFMKIKARRATPTKEVKGKSRKKKEEVRKRTTSKDSSEAKPVVESAPMKSRRKSSTPRKLHCTKVFSESSGHDSPDAVSKTKDDDKQNKPVISVQDSDSDPVRLHWSDEGSLDTKVNEQPTNTSATETEDISKIKEYIASEFRRANAASNSRGSNLQVDLVKRGFDVETAKIIERDLLDSPAARRESDGVGLPAESLPIAGPQNEAPLEKSLESDTSSNLKIVQEDEEEDEIELTVSECNEDSENYIVCNHEDLKDMPRGPPVKLKDNFLMEICMEDGFTMRLRATPISTVLDIDPKESEITQCNAKETERAVSSISNIEKLYTPIKDHIREQVYNIFESTLTSLDTPLKATTPKRNECDTTMTEVVLEVEEVKEKTVDKKRKRVPSIESTDSAASSSKRVKPEAEYLLNSANIQNIDIESVLSKLHGP